MWFLSQNDSQKFVSMWFTFQHDTKVAKGETGPNLFPRPVYEEGPFEQRQKMFNTQKDEFDRNLLSGKNLNASHQQNLDHLYC